MLIEKKIFSENTSEDIFVVHGDTFSTVLGSIIAKILRGKVAHIESGLRSFNILHPFPEELNRIITFKLTDIYYCPNDWAVNNLRKYKGIKINTQLNTLYDSLQLAIKSIDNDTPDYLPPRKIYRLYYSSF